MTAKLRECKAGNELISAFDTDFEGKKHFARCRDGTV
jgi:hypothetical protein